MKIVLGNNKFLLLLGGILIVSLSACAPKDNVSKALELAGNNRIELLKILDYYRENNDSLKLQAALFLIENMPEHYTLKSKAIDTFAEKIQRTDSVVSTKTLNNWWKKLKEEHKSELEYDISILKKDFLIHNIDQAVNVWKASPWKAEVDFEAFCQYILPYRFQDEILSKYWRDSLYQAYHPLIANTKNVKEAFAIIHDTIMHQMGRGGFSFPYLLNVIDMKRQHRATCMQRCVFLGSVLRAVGIPVSIDMVSQWANYSKSGHAWVSLVLDDGTYTIAEKDSVARLHNLIDASDFRLDSLVGTDYPLQTDFKKRAAKVLRSTYQHNKDMESGGIEPEIQKLLINPFTVDVSKEYELIDTVVVETSLMAECAYLCIFRTGGDWMPICYGRKVKNQYVFPNMGDSIVYLPVVYDRGRLVPIEQPFMKIAGRKRSFQPSFIEKQRLILTRKYPFVGSFINNWNSLIGTKFEGSNDIYFNQKEVLYVVEETPVFRNDIRIKSSKAYRYYRYVSPKEGKTPIAELEYWGDNVLLEGIPFGTNANRIERCFDGDPFTMLVGQSKGYTIGIDFGKPYIIDRIVYFPKNDGNFVMLGNEYELFYYDMKWISLGKQKATEYQLIYDNVPVNALLLLKNYTNGDEERIFSYDADRQVWW
ncbi:hypothetical protein [Bacteroides fluxus]